MFFGCDLNFSKRKIYQILTFIYQDLDEILEITRIFSKVKPNSNCKMAYSNRSVRLNRNALILRYSVEILAFFALEKKIIF